MITARVAILCSFNLDLLPRALAKAATAAGVGVESYLSGYGQWEADVVDAGSKLYAFAPTTTALFLDAEDAIPVLSADGTPTTLADAEARGMAAWQRAAGAIRALLERTTGTVLVHTLAAPPRSGLGLLEGNAGYSHTAALAAYNRELRALAARESRVHVLDYGALVADHGWSRWHDARLWHVGRMRLASASLPILARAYARYLAALHTPRRKCLVLDLDNTLWGGVIGEDGMGGIQIGHTGVGLAFREFQLAILALYRRGVILALASKNNPDDALAAIASHPDMVLRPEHFAATEIHWQDKASSVRRLAERLNIGLDSLVFWDDSELERGMMRDQVPEVLVVDVPADPSDYARAALDLPCFDALSLTAEDQRRGQMYREAAERDSFLEESTRGAGAGALDAYYASLEMVVHIDPATDVTIPRIAQLTHRTNQFNLSTKRYSEAEIRTKSKDAAWRVYGMSLRDRFGDLGLIGAALLEVGADAWQLDTFLMSCRALGRRVEDAFAAHLAREALAAGKPLHGAFVPTKKNAPMREMLDRLGWLHGESHVEVMPLEIPSWLRVVRGADPEK